MHRLGTPAQLELHVRVVAAHPDDPLFREATLPEGYTRAKTPHDMWTDILDPDGVKVAAVFYKAAFYDRKAFIRPVTAEERQREAEWLAAHPEEA